MTLMLEAIVFYTLAGFILVFGVMVVTARNTVHSVLFLVANFLCVAVLFVALAAEFLAMIQILVYVGGIVVLYLFVIMLVNLKAIPEETMDPKRRSRLGFALSAAVLLEISAILAYSAAHPVAVPSTAAETGSSNTETVGWLLYVDYLIPFEVASVLLLVAMVGAVLLARKPE